MVLLKQVASYLDMPIFVVDGNGELVFYNESAEALLGHRYEETGQMPLEVWGTLFTPTDSDGLPLSAEQLPLAVAARERQPAQSTFWIRGLDGVARRIAVTAIPLQGRGDTHLGAMAVFWES